VPEVEIVDALVVAAPPNAVWAAIEDPALHAGWHPFVTQIAGEHALGAIRSCTVVVGKKHGETRERCVEEDDGRRIVWAIDRDSTGFSRMVSDWRAGFALEPAGSGTRVTAMSAFRPRGVLLRLLLPIVKRKFHRTQRAILAALAASLTA
jgi:uncharacterized protein YndB with AHSA1/START domain